jgi:hypothetical protein
MELVDLVSLLQAELEIAGLRREMRDGFEQTHARLESVDAA